MPMDGENVRDMVTLVFHDFSPSTLVDSVVDAHYGLHFVGIWDVTFALHGVVEPLRGRILPKLIVLYAATWDVGCDCYGRKARIKLRCVESVGRIRLSNGRMARRKLTNERRLRDSSFSSIDERWVRWLGGVACNGPFTHYGARRLRTISVRHVTKA